jgi:hypothetical protein
VTYSKEVLKLNPQLLEGGNKELAAVSASKYRNVRAELNGLVFASGKEASDMGGLMIAEQQRLIFGLRFQVRFPLIDGTVYVADAVYCELRDGKLVTVVVDSKGFRTREYRRKRRLFKEKYGMEITEL